MLEPTERINRAIVNLEDNPNWEVFKQWILDSFVQEDIGAITDIKSPDFQHRIRQGEALALFKLKNYILTARKKLDQLRESGKEQKRGLDSI